MQTQMSYPNSSRHSYG